MSTLAPSGRDAITDAAFPTWMAMEILCSRKVHDRASPVTILSCWPIKLPHKIPGLWTNGTTSLQNNWLEKIHAVQVSMRIYFLAFSSSTCAATPQGTMVIPSGCFPSARCNPEGSSREGIFAAVRACWMTLCIHSVVTRQSPLAEMTT